MIHQIQRVGIVAAGSIGKMYGRLIAEYFPQTRIELILDKYQSREELAAQGVWCQKVTRNLEELLENREIDRVIVASSTGSHVEICRALIEAGKHIFCEKPVSFDFPPILELGRMAKEKGTKLRVGYVRRHDPEYRELKRRVREKEIGNLNLIKIVNRDPKRPSASYSQKAGSIFSDFMIHDFDMVRYLTGKEIRKVYAEANIVKNSDFETSEYADGAVVTLRLSDDSLAVIDCSRESNYGYDQRIEVFGTKGCLRAENLPDFHLIKYYGESCSGYPPKYDYQTRYKQAFIEELKDFHRSIDGEDFIIAGCEDDAKAIQIAIQCEQSLKEERAVYFNSSEANL